MNLATHLGSLTKEYIDKKKKEAEDNKQKILGYFLPKLEKAATLGLNSYQVSRADEDKLRREFSIELADLLEIFKSEGLTFGRHRITGNFVILWNVLEDGTLSAEDIRDLFKGEGHGATTGGMEEQDRKLLDTIFGAPDETN